MNAGPDFETELKRHQRCCRPMPPNWRARHRCGGNITWNLG